MYFEGKANMRGRLFIRADTKRLFGGRAFVTSTRGGIIAFARNKGIKICSEDLFALLNLISRHVKNPVLVSGFLVPVRLRRKIPGAVILTLSV